MFLPIWLRYYSRHFSSAAIHIIDNDIGDDLLNSLRTISKFGVARVTGLTDSGSQIAALSQKVYADLQKRYDRVLIAEADEIIVPDPAMYRDLTDYVEQSDENIVVSNGFNVIHQKGEAKLDVSRPVLGQRAWWAPEPAWCKPCLAGMPITWTPGLHTCKEESRQDPNLYLIHLQRMDIDVWFGRYSQRNGERYDYPGVWERIPEGSGQTKEQWRMRDLLRMRTPWTMKPPDVAAIKEEILASPPGPYSTHWNAENLRPIPERFREVV